MVWLVLFAAICFKFLPANFGWLNLGNSTVSAACISIALSKQPGNRRKLYRCAHLSCQLLSCSEQQPSPQRNPWGPLLPSCLQGGTGLVSGADAVASMGDGILALENDRVALPGCAGGATCIAESGPGREANSRQFSNFGVFSRLRDLGFWTPGLDVYGRSRDILYFRGEKRCFPPIV